MDNHQDPAWEVGDDERRECPVHRDGLRNVWIPIAPSPNDMPVDPVGSSPFIAAIAAVIRDAMAADAAGGVVPTTSLEDDAD
jgi:hypothetical protein